MELKLYKCPRCGNIVELVEDRGVPVYCCGVPMERYQAGETDGAQEKHLPVVEVDGGTVRVCVGEVNHPMEDGHHIAFIWLVTDRGISRRTLPHTGAPETVFQLAPGETPEAVYELCNLHGLWRTAL